MKKLKLVLLFVLLYYVAVEAQNTGNINGTIKDSYGMAMSNVQIFLENTTTGTVSDEKGYYSLKALPFGTHEVDFIYLGYETVKRTVTLSLDNPNRILNIEMNDSAVSLQDVIVTGRKQISYRDQSTFGATKTETKLIDVPQSVSIVTKEVIADQQAFRIVDVAKNLSGVNSISFYDAFTLRGFELSSETGSLINGLQTIGFFGPQPLLVNVERVEVIKGPASALYGNANPGGTMNSVTKKPLNEERKSVSFTTGSFNTKRAALDFTGSLNEEETFLYRLNLGYENSDSFRTLQGTESYVIAPSFSFLPNENTKVNVELVLTNQNGKLDRGQPIQGLDANNNPRLNSTSTSFAIGKTNDFHENKYDYLNVSLSQRITDNISFNASYLHFDWSEDLQEHRTANGFAINENGETINNLANLRVVKRQRSQSSDNVTAYFVGKLKTGDLGHKIVLGYDYLLQKQEPGAGAEITAQGYLKTDGTFSRDISDLSNFVIENGLLVPNVPFFDLENPVYDFADISKYTFSSTTFQFIRPRKLFTNGVYIQDQVDWKKLKVLLGLRYESYTDISEYKTAQENEIKQTRLLPRVGVVYSILDDVNVYGTYATGFRPQSVADVTNASAISSNLDPEDSNIIEFGAKGEFFNKKLLATTSIYQITRQNIVVNGIDNSGNEIIEQAGEVVSKGFEIELAGNPIPELSLTANYAFNEIEITEGKENFRGGQTPFGSPKHLAGFWGRYTFNNQSLIPGFGIGLGVNTASKQLSQFGTPFFIPGYAVLDGALYYQIDKFKINLSVNNLLDKQYWIGALIPTRLFPGTPRNFLLNVAYTF